MKRLLGIMPLAAVLMIMTASCTADNDDGHEGLVPIYLTATINEGSGISVTRAGADLQGANFANGEQFAAVLTGGVTVNNVTYTVDSYGGTTASSQPYFTLGGTSATVYGYYPQKPTGSTFSVAANQHSDNSYKASDLMYATQSFSKVGNVAAVALQFSHKMSKIIVNATLASGISSITGVYLIGGSRTINLTDVTTCTLGSTLSDAITSGSPLTVFSGSHTAGTLNCAALIPPQTVTGAFLKISTNAGDVIYTLDSKLFATGQSYTFNITLNAAAIGTTVAITNWANNGNATVNPTVELTNAPAGAVAVDLGLSVKWANMNVGATAVNVYGTYFAWGETSGYTVVGRTPIPAAGNVKRYFDWSTYAWGAPGAIIKYCFTSDQASSWYNKTGTGAQAADNKSVLELGDDAAHANWGGNWRMPTEEEFRELFDWDNCTFVWQNSPAGYVITSKKPGYTSNSIFIPAAGEGYEDEIGGQEECFRYWTSSLHSGMWARNCEINADGDPERGPDFIGAERFRGYSVRAVQSK